LIIHFLFSFLSYLFFLFIRHPPISTLFPYTTLFRSANFPRPVKSYLKEEYDNLPLEFHVDSDNNKKTGNQDSPDVRLGAEYIVRSEEHTSELQSLAYLVCRLLLEKKKNKI